MILCFCGHTPLKHLSFDELDNPCQVDGCGCSNYVTLTKEQKERLAQLGWESGTDGQDSSESDSSRQETRWRQPSRSLDMTNEPQPGGG